jgi:hypothetical protein
LTGWRLAGILTLESGEALTVTNGGPGTPCPASDAGTATCPNRLWFERAGRRRF